jgi:phosphatidylglycerophosphatase C
VTETTGGLAAFDFDGTVSRRDTLVPFLALAAGRRRFLDGWRQVGLRAVRGRVDPRDRDAVKAELIDLLLAGRAETELEELGERYARDLLSEDQLRPLVLHRIRSHRARGDTCVLVSASLVYYLRPIARELGMAGVVGVDPEVRDGLLTGSMRRPNVRAEQKVVQLHDWMERSGIVPAEGRRSAYGNTSGDHALLRAADHRYWLGRPGRVPEGAEVLTAATPLR